MRLSVALMTIAVLLALTTAHATATATAPGANMFSELLQSRAACHCPAMTDAEKSQSFLADFGSLLAALETKADNGAANRLKCLLTKSMDSMGTRMAANFNLPSTCTSAAYRAGSACLMQLPVPLFGLTFQMSVQQCPGAPPGTAPSASLSCSGALCSDLLVPCSTDRDCVASTCAVMDPATSTFIDSRIRNWLNASAILPEVEVATCDAFSRQPGLKVFQQLAAVVAQQSLPSSTNFNYAISGLKFCGIGAFNQPSLQSMTILPFIGDVRGVFLLGQVVRAVSYVASYFAPLAQATSDLFVFVAGQVTSIGALAAWDGTLADGSLVTDARRVSGTYFRPVKSSLPTPSMAAGTETVVQLLSSSCNLTVNALVGQPLTAGFYFPAVQPLLEATVGIVRSIASCRTTARGLPDLSAEQFTTRFNALSPQFWLNLYSATPSGFVPAPAEDSFPTPSGKIASKLPDRRLLSTPASCSYASWVSGGQCSFEWTGAGALFSGKQLNLRAQIQQCAVDYPAAFPSISLQCVGADCASFLSTGSQIQSCSVDADCTAGSGKTCALLDPLSWTNFIGRWWFPSATVPNPTYANFPNQPTCAGYPSSVGSVSSSCSSTPYSSLLTLCDDNGNRTFASYSATPSCVGTPDYFGTAPAAISGPTCVPIAYTSSGSVVGAVMFDCNATKEVPALPDACDSGLMNQQAVFNIVKRLTGQPATTFTQSQTCLGLCSLDAQDSILSAPGATSTWASAQIVSTNTLVTVANLGAYTAPANDNQLYPGGGPPPCSIHCAAPTQTAASFLWIAALCVALITIRL